MAQLKQNQVMVEEMKRTFEEKARLMADYPQISQIEESK